MKLLEQFKAIVKEISPDICWFTTFNLNLELAEKYLLTAIAGIEPGELKLAEDYERLNDELEATNVKIWYDYRVLDQTRGKRSTVDVYPVNPAVLLNSTSTDSIFHPKVIFLKGKTAAWLITGSFNLSIAGWSSNRECVAIREIKSRPNALQVIDFFEHIDPKLEELEALKEWAGKLPKSNPSWKFVHTFNTDGLLDEIKGTSLTIWSPYFSKGTTDLINTIKGKGFTNIQVVPDVNESQKVRILPGEYDRLCEDRSITIQMDRSGDKEKQPLYHAKVWLSDKTIGIGSWNCSYQALALSTSFNIEAGIVQPIQEYDRAALLKPLVLIPPSITGMQEAELDAEWDNSLSNYSMSCTIVADWNTFTYELSGENQEKGYRVYLPHDPNRPYRLDEVDGISFFSRYNALLKNKSFNVIDGKGDTVFIGYLNEKGKEHRPVLCYTNFSDLFQSLLNPSVGNGNAKVKYSENPDDQADSDSPEIPFFDYNNGHESYYRMFVAFQRLSENLEGIKSNPDKLSQLGYRLPGSLMNIKTLFDVSLQKATEEMNEDNLLFHYFIATEVNDCIDRFNEYIVAYANMKNIEQIATTMLTDTLKLNDKALRFIEKARKAI